MKKVLFLGAGLDQSYAIQRARALGYYTIAIDSLDQAIGFNYAHQAIHMPVDNISGCLAVAQMHQIDGVMNSFAKSAMITAATIMSQLDLPGVDQAVTDKIKNRLTLRSVLSRSRIMDGESIYLIRDIQELEDIQSFLQFPIIIKGMDHSGISRLLGRKLTSMSDLEEAFSQLMEDPSIASVMVEEFIEGKELSVELFVEEGKLHIVGIMEKLTDYRPEYHELSYASVARMDHQVELIRLIQQAVEALCIQKGSFNMELITTNAGQHHILNLRPGLGGSIISSHIIPKVLRFNYLDNMIRASVGDDYELPPTRYQKNVVSRKIELGPEQVLQLTDIEHFQVTYHVTVIVNKVGDLSELYVIGNGDSRIQAEKKVDVALDVIFKNYIQIKAAETKA